MAKRTMPVPDLSKLPPNWTIKDIEKLMPPEWRKRKGQYKLTFYLVVPEGKSEQKRELPVLINLDEKDRLEEQFTELVELGVVQKWSLHNDVPMDSTMTDIIYRDLKAVAEARTF